MRTFKSSLANMGSVAFFWWALNALNRVFDYGIYTSVVAYYGIVAGGTIMWIAAFALDISLLHIYSYFNKDIFGFETIAGWREYEGGSPWRLLRRKIVGMSDFVVYLFITLTANPFLATVYVRKTDKARKGMDKRDWMVFLPSFIISNLFWTLLADDVAPITKSIWHYFGFFQA